MDKDRIAGAAKQAVGGIKETAGKVLVGATGMVPTLNPTNWGTVTTMTPSTITGAGIPVTSSSVGTMSITWWNCQRTPPLSFIFAGQEIAMPCLVPPK